MNAQDEPLRLGLLYPLGGGEWEYYRFAETVDWRLHPCIVCTRLYGDERNHDTDALARTAALDNLCRAARNLKPIAPHAALWACTSGSFILGRAHAEAQARAIAEVAGCPASSTSLAFVHALAALGVDDVALLATYPEPAAHAMVRFLGEYDLRVSALRWLDAPGGQDACDLPVDVVTCAARSLDLSSAGALLIPDTAMAGFDIVRVLEPVLRIPVLAANQVTLWEGLRIAGRPHTLPGHGRLFESVPASTGTESPDTKESRRPARS